MATEMRDTELQSGAGDGDPVSKVIGQYGPWQLRLTFFLALFNIPCSWHILVFSFQTLDQPYWCARPEQIRDSVTPAVWINASQADRACLIWDRDYNGSALSPSSSNATRSCTTFEFDDSEGSTLVAEWNLVCDQAQLVNVAEMTFLIGVALGGLISGIISDKFGRKKTLIIALVLQIVCGTVISVNTSFGFYLVLRFFLGFVCVSVVFCAFVLCMEIVGGKWRTIAGVSFLFPTPLGYITAAGIAYFIRDWRSLQLAVTMPGLLFLSAIWIMPESPRWLLAMDKREELLEVLKKGATTNKMPSPTDQANIFTAAPPREEKSHDVGVMTLFETPEIRKISLLLYIVWFVLYLVYFGLVLNLASLGGNIYLNTLFSGLVEIVALGLSILLLLNSGRKLPLCLVTAGSGVACLLVLAVPSDAPSWIVVALAMISKFAISCSNAMLPIFSAELYPTVVRNLGMGACNVSAGIALMLVPYLWNLASVFKLLPFVVIGVLGVIGGLCVLLLPETVGKPMPNTLADLTSLVKGNTGSNLPSTIVPDTYPKPPRYYINPLEPTDD